jgi:hypothetical protein
VRAQGPKNSFQNRALPTDDVTPCPAERALAAVASVRDHPHAATCAERLTREEGAPMVAYYIALAREMPDNWREFMRP